MWYDINNTLSHNCLLNFVVGPRGVGKTYSAKRRVIQNFLKKGEHFVYLRRYKTEITSKQMERFFDDIWAEFPECEFKVDAGKFYINKKLAGFSLALSTAAQYKSVPMPKVSLIIFDEFIIDQGLIKYLPNEVVTFNEMYSTIARLRDVKVVFLSNAITFTNPYFIFYDLSLQKDQKIVKKGDILLEMVVNDEYQIAASNTRFGKIISRTDYGRYAIENEFLLDNDTFIMEIPAPATGLFNLRVSNENFTVYYIIGDNKWYVSNKIDPSVKKNISLDVSSHDNTTILTGEKTAALWIEELKQKYYCGNLRFTTLKAKNLISKYLRR